MSTTFSRLLTLLRKERGISQKEAAVDLHVSQALLSHYEKGIRECGLDFVVRVADYYRVSCDYLLGRTADKSGAIIAVDDIPENDPALRDNRGGVLAILNKKLILNSLHILFDVLTRCDCKGLTAEVSTYLTVAVYTVFRELCDANPKHPAAMFSEPVYLFEAAASGVLARSAARAGRLASGYTVGEEEGVAAEKLPSLLPDELTQQYPLFASSLLGLLKNAEGKME